MSDRGAPPVDPDDKDWTWTLDRACPDCGFEASAVPRSELADLVVELTGPWQGVLRGRDVAVRPGPSTWSPLEYACHVRDVCRLFEERCRLVLDEDDPTFADWNQDEAALLDRYGEQDPAAVAAEVADAAAAWARTLGGVREDQWGRTARRSNGSRFTLLSLGRYGLHDLAHHLHDVGAAPRP